MPKSGRILSITIIIIVLFFVTGCAVFSGGERAENGDVVQVHYTGTLSDGTVFDSSLERDPLQFTLGQGQMISGFEKAVLGMKVGQTKKVTIPSSEAYGPRDPNGFFDIPREELPEDLELQIGMQLPMTEGDGMLFFAVIVDITDTTVTMDKNHPLAGKDLTFEIKLVSIL